MESDPHFLAIREFYGDRRPERSCVPYINHIGEGLTVLDAIGASQHAKRAYCLHPIVQGDAEFRVAFNADSVLLRFAIDGHALALAVEYRSVANAYLSHRKISDVSEIRLSPIQDVNDMLIADKIQNRKDFLVHHADSHPRANQLSDYFLNWMSRLNISNARYEELAALITTSSPR